LQALSSGLLLQRVGFFFVSVFKLGYSNQFWMSSMTTPPLPTQSGRTLLQRLLLLAVIGIVASVIFNYLR
jgi:hypothetical protein